MRFAVKTSILSKRWRYIWTSLPTLSFTSSEYDGRPFCPWGSRKWIQPTFFENFVDNALILRNQKSDINKFGLSWYLDRHIETDTIRNHLNTWINAALNRDVAILSVDIGGLLGSDTSELIDSKSEIFRHQFTSKLFNCATLTKLKLKVDIQIYDAEIGDYCKDYLSKINFPKPVHLPCLSVLKLDSIVIDNANSLFLGTPVLEYLSIKGCKISIDNCSDMDWFGILSLTLKYFELKNCIMPKKIKLNVPNLQTLVCEDYTWHEYSMENISSLVCARIEMLDFSSQGDGDHYLKLPEHEKKLCATRAMDFLKALDTVNELQLSPGILENLFTSNIILNEDYTEHRIS
ncbi:hypothetical protein MKW98_029109 [Papaver atlanticum]|uniref:Uncharacterized protein n=1 Tax=Papaver atlanticum TaxID=357466 RepID=A0AAD4S9G6_9MAGN|nr:hypothetical protein MKW98_029109 [Papaver atlanticum]